MGSSITSGTTAVLSTLHDPLCQDLAARFGQEAARLYVLANWEALEKYRTLAQRYACSWEEQPHYRYAMTQAQAERLKVEAGCWAAWDLPQRTTKETPLPFPVAQGGVSAGYGPISSAAIFIWSGFRAEHSRNTPVLGISNGVAFTGGAESWPEDHCCHPLSPGPFRGLYFMKLYQRRSYVIALEGGPDVEGTYAGMGASGISCAMPETCCFSAVAGIALAGKGSWETVRSFAARHFPELPEGMPGPTRTA